jgi:leader peptidase (prepilin peptidase)/N-methyltransferase
MGFGDVKLAGLLGLYLGWLGWSPVWIGTLAGFLLGGLAGVALLVARRAHRRTAIPFGPSMLAGALLAVLLARPIATWYVALLIPAA